MTRDERRERLGEARLCLLFTPELTERAAPLEVLEACLPYVQVLQVRLPSTETGPAPARETLRWTRSVLALCRSSADPPLVLVNDRVDVALALAGEGVDGVHLGTDDLAPVHARAVLGPELLIGLSTHGPRQVVRASDDEAVDYLGFGPIHPTRTKGYDEGLGSEAAWIAADSTALPLFPIGGIDRTNAEELAPVGRAAVSSAILAASDPAAAAREIYELLAADPDDTPWRNIASP